MADSIFTPTFVLPTPSPDMKTLIHLIGESLNSLDVDLRQTMASHFVLTGAGTLIPGFIDRLNAELGHMIPSVTNRLILETQSSASWTWK